MINDETEILPNQVCCVLLGMNNPLEGMHTVYIIHSVFRLTASTSTSVNPAMENSLAQRVVTCDVS
ncbi:hypothetical protein DPMN_148662 [Dreissena polymorpha]|uniref:Uncharacterized protein n=1 Tax=Dreissena polymorpha TaxID=45954 RepID=A0A9D4FBB1_DREPO|nr:hypothetical protein DPMN_148662 [Dreissena polymorpha]